MKAIYFEQHGELDVLRHGEIPDPEPGPNEALIRVKAVALNHLDIWVRKGWRGLHVKMPHVTGSDIAGEIVAVNAPSFWTPGTRVVVNPGVSTTVDEWTRRGEDSISPGYRIIGEQIRGGLAEYVTVPVENLFKIPDGMSYTDAAAPLFVGVTCWRMLFKRANIKAGESMLVVGAGGGVNSLAIKLGVSAGATVYALASDSYKRTKALQLGATEVINYKEKTDWPVEILRLTKGRGVDIVVDNTGSRTLPLSLQSVACGGRILVVGATTGSQVNLDLRLLFAKQVSLIGSTMGSAQDFIDALQFMWSKGIEPIIDSVEPLSSGISMIQKLESNAHFGKILLVP